MDTKGKLAKRFEKMKNNLKEWGDELRECFNYTPTAVMALSGTHESSGTKKRMAIGRGNEA